jgi:reactive intermediate/imine deaminase
MKQAVDIPEAAEAIGPYSHCVLTKDLAFVSGQGPVDPATGEKPDDITGQVLQTLENIQTILKGVGLDMGDVVKVHAYLADLADFAAFNRVYREFFPGDFPARTTIGAQLLDIMVEIDCIAARRG